ncbi:MAG: hypothetical protein ACYSUM_04880 [Planctomycetota bacterium]|jgi:hypothetical protein
MRKRVTLWIAVLALLPLLPAVAGDDENEREIEAAEKRLRAMLREAEELQEVGRREEADRLRRKAEELRAAIERSHEHLRRKREHAEQGEAGEILEGLERGIHALRKLKRHEEAERLMEIARHVKREFAERRGARKEIEVAKWQLKVMRFGVEALVKAKRHDGAALLEGALHARRLDLEGRRDEEAMRIRERAPGPEDQAELLRVAADLLGEWGEKDQAAAVDKLAKQLLERVRHREEREREHGRERPADPERVMHEVERLHERVAHLERVIAELREQVQALRRERR